MKQITYEELKKIECRIPDSFDNLFNEICIESFLLVNFMVGIAQELQDDGMPQYAWIMPKEVVDRISIIENDMLEKTINDMKKMRFQVDDMYYKVFDTLLYDSVGLRFTFSVPALCHIWGVMRLP